jgi:hypothetical protein
MDSMKDLHQHIVEKQNYPIHELARGPDVVDLPLAR